jgi:hypothetical protein
MASLMLHACFTPNFRIVFYCNNILTAFYDGNIIVKETFTDCSNFLKVTWFNRTPEDGTGVPKHVGVVIL